ncbi:MAG: hypothetical protein ACE5Z5_10890 [Candidatus Bathyarchaeia archaeon]
MERLGYVKKERYEEAARERDELRRRVEGLEVKVTELEKERDELKKRLKKPKKAT